MSHGRMVGIEIIHDDLKNVVDSLCALNPECVITDPPYSAKVHSSAVSLGTQGSPHKRDFGFKCIDDDTRRHVARIAARASRWTAVFSDLESSHLWRDAISEDPSVQYVKSVPWVRWSQPQLSGDRPPSGMEIVTLAHRNGRKHWSGPGAFVAFTAKSLRGEQKFSCEKPLDLMLALVSWFSDMGDMVVDPCAGSGTTALACRILSRRCTLVERDSATVAIANRRLSDRLTRRDVERMERWIALQRKWLSNEPVNSDSCAERHARAMADVSLACGEIGMLDL